jgi:hypothetical protein
VQFDNQILASPLDPVTGARQPGFLVSGGLVGTEAFRGFTFAPDGTPWAVEWVQFDNQILASPLDPVTGARQPGFLVSGGLVGTEAFRGFTFAPEAAIVIPEPATWITLILGFGASGMVMRRRGETRHLQSVA